MHTSLSDTEPAHHSSIASVVSAGSIASIASVGAIGKVGYIGNTPIHVVARNLTAIVRGRKA